MDKEKILRETREHVRKMLPPECTAHDWLHAFRVSRNAQYIAEHETADPFIVELAALLHDIADHKFHGGDDSLGPKLAREWLERLGVEEGVIGHVSEIIKEVSFKGAGVKSEMKTLEGMIVQDADRLDAIGAIGIARAFAYGGYIKQEIYDSAIKPKKHGTFEEYKREKTTTINHFYEKLLLLKGMMNTGTGRKMAEERHNLMETFLERFFKEWDGKE